MIDAIISFSIRRRAFVIAAGVALAILGGLAAWTTPVDAIPDLSENQVVVFTEWKGRGPREIEDQITAPVSTGLGGLAGVKVVRGSSEVGFSMISVILDDGLDVAAGRLRVGERLASLRTSLPAGVSPELGPDAAATGQVFWYTVEGNGFDLGRLRTIQDFQIKPQLAAVQGVAEVASVGGFPTEYRITPDVPALERHGLLIQDLVEAATASDATAGGHVVVTGNAEHVVRALGRLGSSPHAGDDGFDSARAIRDLERVPVPLPKGGSVLIGDVADVARAPGFRRGALEKDGNEVVGGVVLLSRGANPLGVIRAIKSRIAGLASSLPRGVRIVPFYDRSALIEGAIGTVTGAVVEAMVSASLCVLVILLHARTALVVATSLPLAALASFLTMSLLRRLGLLDISMTASSLAGIAISIGVLVDSSVVMAENVMHELRAHFGPDPVRGDTRDVVLSACLTVGRPITASVIVMVLSFLPVFALQGLEGRMFHPLAVAKSLALVATGVLAITLTPALCSIGIKGRLLAEQDNPLIRGVIEVYRPVLSYLIDRPAAMAFVVAATLVLGLAPLGNQAIFLTCLFLGIAAVALLAQRARHAVLGPACLVMLALVAQSTMSPLESEAMTPLDEGMVMDMPITVPRASAAETIDDMKARDMVLCRFPEVDMVVGKAGRADTPTDPAPIDMIETMVNFRPREFWPRRKIAPDAAGAQCQRVLDALVERKLVQPPESLAKAHAIVDQAASAALALYDAASREYAYHRYQEVLSDTKGVSPSSTRPSDPAEARAVPAWQRRTESVDRELAARAAPIFTRLVIDELLEQTTILDPAVKAHCIEAAKARASGLALASRPHRMAPGGHHHSVSALESVAILEPVPALDEVRDGLTRRFARGLELWKANRRSLTDYGGELDLAVATPGWTNVWTMPIQNRVDMLATGVNSAIGVRVLGRDLDQVVRGSEEVARVLKALPGAVDVVADPVRGKPALEFRLDRDRAGRQGVAAADFAAAIETALAGRAVATIHDGCARHPVVVRLGRAWRDLDKLADLPIPTRAKPAISTEAPRSVPLSEVAVIERTVGPAMIRSERGLLRNYVRLNAQGIDPTALVARAQEKVEREAKLPEGVALGWTGQFEHAAQARRTLVMVSPLVLGLIFLVLYLTYRDLADSLLVMAAIPGALAGGLLFQWILGIKLSVTVAIGYIACFGMAASTGIIMMVYLREALAKAGGLERLDLEGLRKAVLDGAVHRLRPKLLTEGTVVVGLAPMLWAGGVASEIIGPMTAPVLGGILVADEVIDLFLPVLFYWTRARRWRRTHEGPRPS